MNIHGKNNYPYNQNINQGSQKEEGSVNNIIVDLTSKYSTQNIIKNCPSTNLSLSYNEMRIVLSECSNYFNSIKEPQEKTIEFAKFLFHLSQKSENYENFLQYITKEDGDDVLTYLRTTFDLLELIQKEKVSITMPYDDDFVESVINKEGYFQKLIEEVRHSDIDKDSEKYKLLLNINGVIESFEQYKHNMHECYIGLVSRKVDILMDMIKNTVKSELKNIEHTGDIKNPEDTILESIENKIEEILQKIENVGFDKNEIEIIVKNALTEEFENVKSLFKEQNSESNSHDNRAESASVDFENLFESIETLLVEKINIEKLEERITENISEIIEAKLTLEDKEENKNEEDNEYIAEFLEKTAKIERNIENLNIQIAEIKSKLATVDEIKQIILDYIQKEEEWLRNNGGYNNGYNNANPNPTYQQQREEYKEVGGGGF